MLEIRPTSLPPATARAGEEVVRLRTEHAAARLALQRAVHDISRLTRMLTILTEQAPIEQMLDRVLATLSELFLADIVVLLDATGQEECRPLASVGLPEEAAGRTMAATPESSLAAALRQRFPVAVADLQADPTTEPQLRELGAETAVWLPVIGDKAIRGVLLLSRCRQQPFTAEDIGLLIAMAYRCGLMLDRVHEEKERWQLEVRLRQAEKTESLGRMAGAIAHHFNNMLGVVEGGLDVAIRELPRAHEVQEDLQRALAAARRAADMSGVMLAYLGQNAGHRVRTDLSQVVHETVRSLRGSAPANVRLVTQLPAAGPMVSGDAAQLGQVLSNLVVNGWESLGTKEGEVRISLSSVQVAAIPPARVAAAAWAPKAASYACLEIADDGAGMSPATLDRIFDPFFTTKSGRGLGLPLVLGTVRAHEGALAVRSTEARGTTFQVFLPELVSVVRSGAADSDQKPGNGVPAGGGLVLVADDEEIVRQMTRRILIKLGYEVVTAADGSEAVERFRQQPDAFRLVLLDLTMPCLDGWAALAAIRAVRPAMPVILASGYDGTQVMAGEHGELPQMFLQKPYLMDDLKAAIDRALVGD